MIHVLSRRMKLSVPRQMLQSPRTLPRLYWRQDRRRRQRRMCMKYPRARLCSRMPVFLTKHPWRVLSFLVYAQTFEYFAQTNLLYTVDVVERAAGLTLFSDAVKAQSKHICKSTKCDVTVRRFDDAQKRPEMRRAISAPK